MYNSNIFFGIYEVPFSQKKKYFIHQIIYYEHYNKIDKFKQNITLKINKW